MKNIYFLAPTMTFGGTERVLRTLLFNFDPKKYNITLVLLREEGDMLKDLPSHIKVISLNISRARYAFFSYFVLFFRASPDIVFCFSSDIALALVPSLFFFKKIKFLFREQSVVDFQGLLPKRSFLHAFLKKLFYKKIDKIVCQCEEMMERFLLRFPYLSFKTEVISNPIDLSAINLSLAASHLSLSKKAQYTLLAVGRLEYVKGYDLLIDALGYLGDIDVELVFLGDGSEKERLVMQVEKLGLMGRVSFLGKVSPPFSCMSEADLLVVPSRFEGFPNVVLEANACGTPVVAFACPSGLKELVNEGENGFLAKPEDATDLACKIRKALVTPFDKNTIVCYVEKRYSVDKIVCLYDELFQNLS